MIYTIGFTKKTAQHFFELLKNNSIETLIDVRLNNTSQLAAFAKSPDLEYFLKEICSIKYIHDTTFAPTDVLLKNYKKGTISWIDYEQVFERTMESRKIDEYIERKYMHLQGKNFCLLCSEDVADKCHRRLVAQHFRTILNSSIVNL